ncbi:zinc finger protein egl-43 isoform X2 [Parasteatoda tepidariorum]|uniref:zinc finger protein egl-43 isoform X2 n=1 Tax=Parasteatoda tepidariorum TaxID=114398 RepID=UPI00077F81D7|nr:zinc finger protein 26 isoform X2 [Parasteatoda tepidariorum]XP_042901406.1 zinc finger protein 26 isoform X2 [Parasteatoda tepidariorum]XP_042901407.1 zinc finger protein 26 isoform X2 [Parasteatoda tepidariorum]
MRSPSNTVIKIVYFFKQSCRTCYLFQSDILLDQYPDSIDDRGYLFTPYEPIEDEPIPEVSPQSKITCMYCSKVFAHKRYLVDHLNTHTGKKPHICKYCSKAFTQRASRNRHVKLCHKDIISQLNDINNLL